METLALFLSELAQAHSARRLEPTALITQAKVLLSEYSLKEIFDKRAQFWKSRHIARSVGFNGGIGIRALMDVMQGLEGVEPGREGERLRLRERTPPPAPLKDRTPEEREESRRRIRSILATEGFDFDNMDEGAEQS